MNIKTSKLIQLFNLVFIPLVFSTLFVYFPESTLVWIGIISLSLFTCILLTSHVSGKLQNNTTNYILYVAFVVSNLSLLFFQNDFFPVVVFINFILINLIVVSSSSNLFDEYRFLHFIKLFFYHFIVSFLSGGVAYYISYINKAKAYFNIFQNKSSEEKVKDPNEQHYFVATLLFALFAIPIFLFVISQLSAANSQFAEIISNINLYSNGNVFLQIFIFVILVVIVGGVYRFAELITSADLTEIENSKISITYGIFLFFEAVVVMLNLIYFIFAIVEASCNMKGLRECIVNVKNYESYSRATYDGVVSIAFVIILNLIIQYFTQETRNNLKKIFNDVNNYVLIILTLLLSVASFERLYLYISTYGFTVVRIQSIFFYVFVLVACILSAVMISKKKNLVNIIISSGILSLVLITVLPFNWMIFEMNWYMAKNNMIQSYDVFYPYESSEMRDNLNLKKELIERYDSGELSKMKGNKISEIQFEILQQVIGKEN